MIVKEAIEKKVWDMVTPIADEMKFELVDVEYEQEGNDWFLRVSIDTANGVDLELCGAVSERISEVLDKDDPISNLYYLDVASPGIERPLKKEEDFVNAVGKRVHVTLSEPVEDVHEMEGTLLAYENGQLTIERMIKTRKKKSVVSREHIGKARLAVSFA
ncbi:MAG: ribosome maturation factor RimP [Bacilli bacterium]